MRKPRRDDAMIVFEALENERCLDLRYKTVFRPAGRFLNYKVMKQVALQRRLGPLLTPALFAAAALVPVLLLGGWLRSLVLSFAGATSEPVGRSLWLVPTTPTNEVLIRGAVAADEVGASIHVLDDCVQQLAARLGPVEVMRVGCRLLRLLGWIVTAQGRRTDLLLHARDALGFMLLAAHARRRRSDVFATDDHYQRWSFVLSHRAAELRLVQHGVLDDSIDFPHCYGHVHKAYVRDKASDATLRRYYTSIAEVCLHTPATRLTPNPYAATGVFIASSFPTLQEEIAFARALRELRVAPIIVKLHPAHRYDGRKAELLSIADHVCRADESPACRVFVSHSSSMELIYQHYGVPTVSLLGEGGTTPALHAVVACLRERDGLIETSTN